MSGPWDEAKHPRDGGKFAAKGGGGSSPRAGAAKRLAAAGSKRKKKGEDKAALEAKLIAGGFRGGRPEGAKAPVAKAAVATAKGAAGGGVRPVNVGAEHHSGLSRDAHESSRIAERSGSPRAHQTAAEDHAMAASAAAKAGDHASAADHRERAEHHKKAVAGHNADVAEQRGDGGTMTGGPGGLQFKTQTHYVGGYGADGTPRMIPHEGPTVVHNADHGQYMITKDRQTKGKHIAIYFPKDRGASSGGKDVQFIDEHGRPNAGEMAMYGHDGDAMAAIEKHHKTIKSGKKFGVYDPNRNSVY